MFSTASSTLEKVRTEGTIPSHKTWCSARCSTPSFFTCDSSHHPTVLRAWRKATSACSAKVQRAPSQHCRNASANGHRMTTANHELRTTFHVGLRRHETKLPPDHEPLGCFDDPPVQLAPRVCCMGPQNGSNAKLLWSFIPWRLGGSKSGEVVSQGSSAVVRWPTWSRGFATDFSR